MGSKSIVTLPSPANRAAWRDWLSIALLSGAVAVAFGSSLHGRVVFDDSAAIIENPTIRHLEDMRHVLTPPSDNGVTVGGRPLLNLTFALNYAWGGFSVVGYHVVNVLIHLAATLALYGIARRTLLMAGHSADLRRAAGGIAFVSALVWAAHPLQTESVTYIVQRAESLMGLLFLVTLYAFVRYTEAKRGTWFALAVVSCAAGMATKEVMVTAPVVVLLYDRIFISSTWREVWRRHGRVHAILFSTWCLLGLVVAMAGNRGGTIGPAAGIAWWQYALCQSRAIWLYLRLSAWPHPLILDYGSDFVGLSTALPFVIFDLALIAVIARGLRTGRHAAFLGAVFLCILAPSSSVVGGSRQMLAEHRMYLPLAAVVLGAVVFAFRIFGRRALLAGMVLGGALVSTTVARNRVYQSDFTLWSDTVAKRPQNAGGHVNLGLALESMGHLAEAMAEYRLAERLDPNSADAHNNIGEVLCSTGQAAEAIAEFAMAVTLRPTFAAAEANLGGMLASTGRAAEGIPHLERAVQLAPESIDAQNNLAIALLEENRLEDARAHARRALEIEPRSAEAHNTLGLAAMKSNQPAEAAQEFSAALQLDPGHERAQRNLAQVRSTQ